MSRRLALVNSQLNQRNCIGSLGNVPVILDIPARVRSSRQVKHLVNTGRTQTLMNPQGLFLNTGFGNSSWNMYDMVVDS